MVEDMANNVQLLLKRGTNKHSHSQFLPRVARVIIDDLYDAFHITTPSRNHLIYQEECVQLSQMLMLINNAVLNDAVCEAMEMC